MIALPQECSQNNLFYFYYKGDRYNLITSKIIATSVRGSSGSRSIYFYVKDPNIIVSFSFQNEFKGFLKEDPKKGGFIKFCANKIFNPLSPISFLSFLKDYEHYGFEITKKVLDKIELGTMIREYETALNYDGSIRHSSCRPFFVTYKELYDMYASTTFWRACEFFMIKIRPRRGRKSFQYFYIFSWQSFDNRVYY